MNIPAKRAHDTNKRSEQTRVDVETATPSNKKEISRAGGIGGKHAELFRNGAVGFIDWLDAALELRERRGRRLTPRGRGYSWCRCVTLPGKAFLQLICDSLFDHVLNGIGKRR